MTNDCFWPKIFCFLILICTGCSLKVKGESALPSYKNIIQRNVSLEMEGFRFTSGIDAKGNPLMGLNGSDGRGIVDSKWTGSGFFVKKDGTMVTNFHVASKALRGKAVFEDGVTCEINHIKVYDNRNDIAILKVKSSKKFPTVILGDSDSVMPMDKVLAVGNTLSQGLAVTEGIVNRLIKNERTDGISLIRHSASIAPGNSGGALYNGNNVIGINTLTDPLYEMNYAVPINKAKHLLQNPKYNRVIPLEDAFPANIQSIEANLELQLAVNGIVSAPTVKPYGVVSYPYEFSGPDDYLIHVVSPGRDLAITVGNDGELLGIGNLKGDGFEEIYISFDLYKKVIIAVFNYGKLPANYGLKIYRIAW